MVLLLTIFTVFLKNPSGPLAVIDGVTWTAARRFSYKENLWEVQLQGGPLLVI